MSDVLAFVIEGRPPSGNRAARIGQHGGLYTPSETREYRARLESILMFEMRRQKFRMVEYAELVVVIRNIHQDVDNAIAEILDGLQGSVYPNDGRVIDCHIYKRKDNAGPRIAVRVTPANLADTGYTLPPRKRRIS